MPRAFNVQECKIVILGRQASGRTSLHLRFEQGMFCDTAEYDPYSMHLAIKCHPFPIVEGCYRQQRIVDGAPTILEILDSSPGEDYVAMREAWIRAAEFILVCHSCKQHDTTELENALTLLARVRDLEPDAPLPAFIVLTMVDLRDKESISREPLLAIAAKHGTDLFEFVFLRDKGVTGFYETSAMTGTNVEETFFDAIRFIRARNNEFATKERARLQKEMDEKFKGPSKLLPWKLVQAGSMKSKIKQLESNHLSLATVQACPSGVQAMSEEEIAKYRFPPPTSEKIPLSFFKDIAQLLDSPVGKETADVLLRAEDSTQQFPAHRIILCVRADYFRRRMKQMSTGTLEVIGITSDALLREVLNYLYTNCLTASVTEAQLPELEEAASILGCAGLKNVVLAAQKKKDEKSRILVRSDAVQKEMRPALSGDMKDLADIEIVIEKQTFRLHRAILIARCKWLQALLADRWKKDAAEPVVITSFSADVFATVVEFLYSARAQVADELALEVLAAADLLDLPRLAQLAEQAMQPHVDAENAVEVYASVCRFNAPLLKATCMDWMAAEIDQAKKHKQWPELGEEGQAKVMAEHARLLAKREELRKMRVIMQKLPCLLAP